MKVQQTSNQELDLRREATAATEGHLSMEQQQQHPTKNSIVESGRLQPGGYFTSVCFKEKET